MITLDQDAFGRNVFYDPATGNYIVYVDPDNTEVGITVHFNERNDERAYYTINAMAPG